MGSSIAVAASDTSYSIVLASAAGKKLNWELRKSNLYDGYSVYVERTSIKGVPWERLCLGDFDNRQQAIMLQQKLVGIYPGAWVRKTGQNNVVSVIKNIDSPTVFITRPKTDVPVTRASITGASTLSTKQLESLMQRAKDDFKRKNYSSSIRYFNALLDAGEHKYSREALELLGLARQRKGQKTRAVETYEKYLKLYPDTEGVVRVKQRLTGLLTESDKPREKIRMLSEEEEKDELITHGSLTQYYQKNTTKTENDGSIETLSQLITIFDVTAEFDTTKFDQRVNFIADHVYDFIDSNDDSEFRFIEAYYDLSYRKTGSSVRIGRQRLPISGLLRRFDGVTLGYQINPSMRLNVLAGLPVDIQNKTSVNDNKQFYGFVFETGTFLNHWSANLFYFDEKNDGLTNRNTIGTEVRYRNKRQALYGMIDYDLFYDEINSLQLNANIIFDHGRTAYLNAFLRKAPFIATENALIGRQEKSLDELKKVLNQEQIYQLARDRTANSETITIGGTQQLSNKYQLTADITFAHIDDTIASGGVEATPEIGADYYFSTQLVANNLLMKSDTCVLGLRYYDTDLSETISFIVNASLPVTRMWRINPRLQFDNRNFNDGESQRKIRTMLRTYYRYLSNVRLDFEVGYDDINGENTAQFLGNNNLFFTLGYRWDF